VSRMATHVANMLWRTGGDMDNIVGSLVVHISSYMQRSCNRV